MEGSNGPAFPPLVLPKSAMAPGMPIPRAQVTPLFSVPSLTLFTELEPTLLSRLGSLAPPLARPAFALVVSQTAFDFSLFASWLTPPDAQFVEKIGKAIGQDIVLSEYHAFADEWIVRNGPVIRDLMLAPSDLDW